MNTQRLLIMMILLNLITGISMSLDQSTNPNYENLENQYTWQDEEFNDNINLDGGTQTDNVLEQNSLGNSISWWNIILKSFTNALNPFSVSQDYLNEEWEKPIFWIIRIFRSMMYLLVILEIVLLIKNKKTG